MPKSKEGCSVIKNFPRGEPFPAPPDRSVTAYISLFSLFIAVLSPNFSKKNMKAFSKPYIPKLLLFIAFLRNIFSENSLNIFYSTPSAPKMCRYIPSFEYLCWDHPFEAPPPKKFLFRLSIRMFFNKSFRNTSRSLKTY